MEQKKPITHFAAALIISAILILYTIVYYYLELYTNQALGWVAYIILFAGVIIFVNLYGKANNYRLSFGGLFSYGFKATAIITLIAIAFSLIFHFMFPEFKEKIMEMMQEEMATEEGMTSADIDRAMDMVNRYYLIGMIGGTLLGCMLAGTIASLIGAAVTKKNKVNPLDQLSI